jgi:ankyrin repeat protein
MDSFENISASHEQLEDLTEFYFGLSISELVVFLLAVLLFSYVSAKWIEDRLRANGFLGDVYEQKLLFVPDAGTKPEEEHEVTETGLLLSLYEGPRKRLDEAETLDRLKDINKESNITQVEIHRSSMKKATDVIQAFHVFLIFKTTSEAGDGDYWWSLEKNLDYIVLQRSRNKDDVKNKLYGEERKPVEHIIENLDGKGSIKDLFGMLLTHQVIEENYNIDDSNCESLVYFVSKRITEKGYEYERWHRAYSPLKCERNPNVLHLQVINLLTGVTDWPTLFILVYLKNTDVIDKVMKSGNYDINALHGGITPLQFAIMYSKTNMVKHLLKDPINADPTTRDTQSGGNALHTAVTYTPETEIIDLLLAHPKVNVDDVDGDGESALHRAARVSDVKAVQKLLEKGANPSVMNKEGWSPLHVAAFRGNETEIIDLILQAQKHNHVDDDKSENGATALHYAAASSNEIITQHLINKGADLHSRDKNGDLPLHYAVFAAENMKNIDLLLQKLKDADMLFHYRNDDQLLYNVFRNQHLLGAEIAARLKAINRIQKPQSLADKILEVLHRVIEIPANLLRKTIKKVKTFFFYFTLDNLLVRLRIANAKNSQEIDEILKQEEIGINNSDENGETPLFLAIRANNVNAVRCLLEKGADPTRRNNNGLTPFQVATIQPEDNVDILDLLLANDKVDINDGGKSGYTLLHLAMATSDVTTVRFLLSKGANPNVADQNGATPLHVAAYCADTTDVLGLILEKKEVVINRLDNDGQTALHYAVRGKRVNNVGYLLENGADRTICDKKGNTPFQVAAAAVSQDSAILDLLLANEKKSEIDERNNAEDLDIIELPASQENVVNVNSLDNSGAHHQHIQSEQSEEISNPLKNATEVIGNTSSGVQSTAD